MKGNPTGRPCFPINWEKVNKYLTCGCSGIEIASHFDINKDTLYDAVVREYGISFTEYSAKYYEKGNSLLREAQFEKAIAQDNTMMIWLGKQRLGQKENQEEPVSKEILTKLDDFMNYLGSTQSHRNIDDNKSNNAQ